MNNIETVYDWSISHVEPLSQKIACFYFKAKDTSVLLSFNPFEYFGKYVNLRRKGLYDVKQYSIIYTQSPEYQTTKEYIVKFANNKYGFMPGAQSESVKLEDFEEYPTTSQSLLIMMKRQGKFSKGVFGSAKNKAQYSIKGPFGSGLKINRFSFGKHIILAMGTGVNPFIDFIDFILRKSIFEFARETDGIEFARKFDPWKSDMELSFGNKLSFSFYLSFASSEFFIKTVADDLNMIKAIESKSNVGLVRSVKCRIANETNELAQNYQNLDFTKEKVTTKNIKSILKELGAEFDEQGKCDVEKLVVCGKRELLNTVRSSLSSLGLTEANLITF